MDSTTATPPDKLSEELFHGHNHALLRAILDGISEGLLIADASGKVLYASPFSRRSLGTPESNAPHQVGDKLYGVFQPDERTPIPLEKVPMRRALKGEEVRDAEVFVRKQHMPEGLHLRISTRPVRDEGGQILGVIGYSHSLDTQRRLEAEKRRTERHFQLLVELAQEGVWTVDAEGRTTYANRFMAGMLGTTVEEMMGKSLFSFMDEEGRRIAERDLERRRQGIAEVQDFKLIHSVTGAPIWTSMSTSPLHDEQGNYTGALALVSDVTQRRLAEEQVRQLNEQLERRIAERTAQLEFSNRELEAFAYSVAHDLRAPLRSISSFSEALVEDCAPCLDDTGLDYLRRIRAGALRMSDLIDGILALSRVNRMALATSPCDLSALARSVCEQLQLQQPERGVRFTLQEGLADRGDSQLLRLVLDNLLGNAWKFTRERPLAEIEFGVRQEPGGARTYFVRDNGAGFDMAYQDKLFGVFQRLHTQSEFEGNGVGLATVQRIIRRHGGRVWAEGHPGRGATFFFTLNETPLPPGTAPLSNET